MSEREIEVIEIFGKDKVAQVKELVDMSDPDGTWSLYRDLGDDKGVEIVEMLYFDID